MDKPRLVCVSMPTPHSGGGGLRALRSLKEYSKYFETYLFPLFTLRERRYIDVVKELQSTGVKISGYINPSALLYGIKLTRKILYLFPRLLRPHIGAVNFKGVVALHEGLDAIFIGNILGDYFNIPKIALLQLPPFYSSKDRVRNILRAAMRWRKLIAGNSLHEKISNMESIVRFNTYYGLTSRRLRRLLGKYDVIITVSKSIPMEMGDEWLDRVVSLDPGVSLDEDDLRTIISLRSSVRRKANYLIFGGRPVYEKGFIDALIAFKSISRHHSDLKLIVTGYPRGIPIQRLRRACRKLGVEDKVLFTGFLARERRFELVAKARLMLYPSYMDAFPYAVLESLYLGTPVVGYSIPALDIYYGKHPSVKLVSEGDIEALTIEALNMLEKTGEFIEPPKIRSWREIMDEEVSLIKKTIEKLSGLREP
ncbi:MAG: glycosyltransferase family 4 protein [Desulfurococcus sp.]|uniref:glycosyltransferase family 4 protein n=2 Tax=Desulfurococcus sp. TaxID=51678 RepID=UPI003160BDD7